MATLQFRFSFQDPDPELTEILIAYLSEAGFEGFFTEDENLDAYISESNLKTGKLQELLSDPVFFPLGIKQTSDIIAERNWNELWEKSYEPVIVDGICAIIAPFHDEFKEIINILIEPKMSFGTGHHATTRLMIKQIDALEMQGKSILDMGCGTGVLGIFALMRGAESVLAIDIDEWACENSRENFIRNSLSQKKYRILQGNADSIPPEEYDIILANINRNILLSDIPAYNRHLKPGGIFILSGILDSDYSVIDEKLREQGLILNSHIHEGSWISLSYNK